MARALTNRAFRCGKANRRSDGDPVGVFAVDVPAVDDIDRKNLIGAITYAGLKSRPDYTGNIGGAGLPECLDGPLQDVGKLPVETDPVGQIVPVDREVPKPACIEVDTHGFGQAKRGLYKG